MNINAIRALRKAAAEKHKLRVEKEIRLRKLGMKEVGRLSRRDLFVAGLTLYWGEGYKGASQELGFTNSDPASILFFLRWITEIYKISRKDLILRVSINNMHARRVHKVEKYWSRLTGIPTHQFTTTSLIRAAVKKVYTNHNKYYGTLRVKVRRGTDLRRKILGSIEQCKQFATR